MRKFQEICLVFLQLKKNIFHFPKKCEIRFIDSFKFLQTSLANLVSNLQPSDFKNLNRVIKSNSSLLTRKGVYPYDYVSSIDKLKETKLPSKEDFYSKLLDEDISDEDFQHAHNIWNTFNCQTLQDYHDLYLKTDVLLLADVFENFRKTCLKHYKLDPCHYFTVPGLAWDACLKETKQNLQLLKDYDMLMIFEQGIRGGILLFPSKKALCVTLQKFETISPRRNDTQKSTSRDKVLSITLDGALYQKKY